MNGKQRCDAGMLALTPEEKERLFPLVEERMETERPPKTAGTPRETGRVRRLSELRPDEESNRTGEDLLSLSKKTGDGFYTVSRTVGGEGE